MTAISSETGMATYATADGNLVNVVGRDILTPDGARVVRVMSAQGQGLYDDRGVYLCAATDDFTILPKPGDILSGNIGARVLEVEHTEGHNLRIVTHSTFAGPYERQVGARDCDPRVTATEPAPDEATRDLARALAQMWRARQRDADAAKEHLDALVSDAHHYADANDLCEKFDEFMEAHNLPARKRTYAISVNVTMAVSLEREASSAEEAQDMIDSDDVLNAIRDKGVWSDDWDIDEVDHV